MTTIGEFLTHPDLLGRDFSAESWSTWKIVLKAALGEPLTAAERARFVEVAGREPPARRVHELWLALGRRAGKDSATSALITYLATYGDFAHHLRRGERATIACLAVDKAQAQIVFRYIKSYFEEIPVLRRILEDVGDGVLSLNNGIDVAVMAANYRSLRGRSIAAVVLDEVSFWRSDDSALPDFEAYAALVPALITLREAGSMLIAISTTHRKAGLFYERVTEHLANPTDDALAILAPSTVFNPNLLRPAEAAEIARLKEQDPEVGAAEWDSTWRSDLVSFIDRDVAQRLVDTDVFERPYDPRIQYVAMADVAAGNGGDAFTCSIAHQTRDGIALQDAIRIWKPPFSPEDCFQQSAALARAYGCLSMMADHYAAGISVERFAVAGMTIEPARPKSQLYLDFLHLANSGRCRLLDNRQQFRELIGLERRTRWGGGESVDHPRNGHDDAINAGAGALVLAQSKASAGTIPLSCFLPPVDHPNLPPPQPTGNAALDRILAEDAAKPPRHLRHSPFLVRRWRMEEALIQQAKERGDA